MSRILLLLAFCLSPLTATADETWITPRGTVVYEKDFAGMAVLSLPLPNATAMIYFPGLASNFTNRSTHEGFWIANENGPCSASLAAPDGQRSTSWGKAVIAFDRPAFPTDWSLWLGNCLGPATTPIRGLVP